MEQENVYRQWNLNLTFFDQSDAARLALIKSYFCPTRRAPMVSRGDMIDNAGQSFPPTPGCQGDYGVCAGNSLPPDAIWSTPTANGAIIRGTGRDKPGFGSQTRFASITDGVSNTIFVGEKHITPDAVLTRADPSIFNGDNPGMTSRWGGPAQPIARAPTQRLPQGFGSWHPDICQFVMGDGRVIALRAAIDGTTLGRLTTRDDGEPVGDF
jgi:hypothetical protein